MSADGVIHRDLAALERVKYTPQACAADPECPVGSHCDDGSHACTWQCLADSDCGPGQACDALGRCALHAPRITPHVSSTTSACQALPAQEVRDGLLGVGGVGALNDQHLGCFLGTDDTTDGCPCGSYCSIDAECHVDCLAVNPPPGYEAGAGMECSPSGRRIPAGAPPTGPPLQVSLEILPSAISANTATGPVVVPFTVAVDVNSLEFLQATHPAKVRYHVEAKTGPTPLMKCASNATPSAFCDLNGNWKFNLTTHNLRSTPRTIWVQIPKTTTPMSWTMVARSESANASTTAAVLARPLAIPATDPGHYKGTLTWANLGAATGTPPLALPVEAIVTPTTVALFEPTQVVLPDGHAVLSRDPSQATLLGWLSAQTGTYDVRLDLGALAYTTTTGHLAGGITLTTGGGPGSVLTLALDRTGDATAPACSAVPPPALPATGSCPAGTYCEPAMNLCLAGTAPASGAGIKPIGLATASSQLASSQVQAWAPAVTALATGNPALLGGTGLLGIGHAYCYQPLETLAAKFGMTRTLRTPSFDLGCIQGPQQPVAEYDQTTFAFANQTHELALDSHNAQTFNLLDACLGDLAVTPASPFTPANLLGTRSCASLARFYLALGANAGQTFDLAQMRMVTQVLRQWLGVNAYVANTSVQDKQYDDALGASSAPAETRLGQAVDLVDQGLRVVLDPTVRPQFGTGALSPLVAVTPDYRIAQRPVARWSYNGAVTGTFPGTDGNSAFSVPAILALSSGIRSNDPNVTGVTAVCKSNDAIAVDNSRFSLVFYLQNIINGGSFIIFDKTAADGQRIWVEATPGSPTQLALVLKDSFGGRATFPPITSANGVWGLLGLIANNGSYQLVQAVPGATNVVAASSVVNGGPHWGSAGPVSLGCNLPTTCQNGMCTSWDRNTVGDGLDVVYSSSNERAWTRIRTCTTTPGRRPPTSCGGTTGTQDQCNTSAATRQAQLISQRFPNPPASLRTMFVGGNMTQQTTTEDNDGSTVMTTTYWCDLTITDQATPVNGVKPVCGCSGSSTTWVPQGLFYDELSLWSRPLEAEEISTLAASYNFVSTNESMPPAGQALPGAEQAASLAVHLVEAAGADLHLLASYLDAERAVSYGECYQGGASPARDRARGRAGKNLRLVAVLEAEAARLGNAPGGTTAPWYPRYQASQTVLAARRARVVQALQRLTDCKNPLDIPEEELPLFVGQTVSAAERFFASTRFLTARADTEITAASTALTAAQSAYNAQVTADFTRQLTQADQASSIEKLKVSYDGVLRRYCGAPAGGAPRLIDGFMAGTVNADNCFFKTEVAACQNLGVTPIANIPPDCLRGEIGERFMAIKSAYLDATAAQASVTRATEQFNADTLYCALRQIGLESNQVLLQRHQEHMVRLRQDQDDSNDIAFGIGGIANLFSENYGAAIADFQSDANLDTNFHIQQEQDAYQLEVAARSVALDVKECFHKADNDEFAIRAANDIILRANEAVVAAVFALNDARASLTALASEAKGQVGLESSIDRTPPHLHYWLDNAIDTYNRHMVLARRLSYLAVRAYEYEAQQSSGRRGTVLTARRPDDLAAVTAFLEGKSAPVSGGPFVFGDHAFVLSMRDELLHIEDLSGNLHLSDGDPPLTSTEILRRYLISDASKIYGANHQLIGHGIRFSIRPDFWNGNVCAERMSRVVPLVSHSLPAIPAHPELLLIQDNAFASQQCGAPAGSLAITRVGAMTNLVTDDASTAFAPLATSTSMLVSLAPSTVTSRETLADLPFGPPSGFAGRGIYGNYTLVFPTDPTPCTAGGCSGWSDDAVAKLNDVLFRFEIVDGTQQLGARSGVKQ